MKVQASPTPPPKKTSKTQQLILIYTEALKIKNDFQ